MSDDQLPRTPEEAKERLANDKALYDAGRRRAAELEKSLPADRKRGEAKP